MSALLEERKRQGLRPPKFVTLTQVAIDGERLEDAQDRFNGSLRRLYRCVEFRRRVAGALVCREVTWNNGHWHFHAHALLDCSYWPIEDLRKLWQKKGGGHQVYITEARERTEREVVKYPLKALTIPDAVRLREAVEALRGRRMVSSLGKWRELLRDEDLEPVDAAVYPLLDSGAVVVQWHELLEKWRAGEAWAAKAMRQMEAWFRNRAGPDGGLWFAACVAARRLRFDVRGIGNVFDAIPGGHRLEDRLQLEGRLPFRLRTKAVEQ